MMKPVPSLSTTASNHYNDHSTIRTDLEGSAVNLLGDPFDTEVTTFTNMPKLVTIVLCDVLCHFMHLYCYIIITCCTLYDVMCGLL